MLVYGDRTNECRLALLTDACSRTLPPTHEPNLDEIRGILILAGQIEQAVHDRRGEALQKEDRLKLHALVSNLTDEAAACFCTNWSPKGSKGGSERIKKTLEALQSFRQECVTATLPEGFAYYSLFPEQYCASALQWAAQRADEARRRVLVVGIRSIGTTLSAVVRATLRASGWHAERLTIRPIGPVFDRVIDSRPPFESAGFPALIVDEGPGLSGSSMAAAAEWLLKAGISDIAFLPGHKNGPGEAASERILQWWSKIPTYYTGLSEIRWNGATIQEVLANDSVAWCGAVKEVRDLSAGAWRSRAFESRTDWPAVCTGFERAKILCVGERSAFLWKFQGLGGIGISGEQTQRGPERRRKMETFVCPTVRHQLGFIAMPWIEGTRLAVQDANNPSVLEHIARYIACAAGPPLEKDEKENAIRRLTAMLLCNSREALGQEWETLAARLPTDALKSDTGLSYGDGRLAPHKWVQTQEGKILKTDGAGHNQDHTLVGKQSVLWDVAGAITDWDLNEAKAELLTQALSEYGVKVNSFALEFYKAAYVAFRVGLVSFGIGQAGDDQEERARLFSALENYKWKLRAILASSPVAS